LKSILHIILLLTLSTNLALADGDLVSKDFPLKAIRGKVKDSSGTAEFVALKGNLPIPTSSFVSIKGLYPKKIDLNPVGYVLPTPGISINCEPGTTTHAVAEGTISSILKVKGSGLVVMIRHGVYRTIYSGIEKSEVKKGDKVEAGQLLGTIATLGGKTELNFQMWETKDAMVKIDPAKWITQRPQTPKQLGERVFFALQSNDSAAFIDLIFTKNDCDLMVQHADGSESLKKQVATSMYGIAETLRTHADSNFNEIRKTVKDAGIDWQTAQIYNVDYKIRTANNLESTRIIIICRHSGGTFGIKLSECRKSDAWLMLDQLEIRFPNH